MLIDLNPGEAVGLPYYMVKDSGDENEIKLDDSQVSLLESNHFFYKLWKTLNLYGFISSLKVVTVEKYETNNKIVVDHDRSREDFL